MKKTLALLLVLSGSSGALAANEADYIPWTFDDFDRNCEVITTPVAQPRAEPVADPNQAPGYIPWTFDDFDRNGEVVTGREG